MPERPHSLAAIVGRYAVGSLLVAVLVVAGVAIRVAVTAGTDDRRPTDAIVVLGAAEYDGDPSSVFQARLDRAVDLYSAGVAGVVVTVGGKREGDDFTEAESGRRYLVERGVPAAAALAVGEGNDTLVSLRAGALLLSQRGWSSVVLVTDSWHAYRAGQIAIDLGLDVAVSPVSVDSQASARYLLRETLGTLYYRLVGGSSGLGGPVL